MAELILTEQERRLNHFVDWDDAALGKACKKIALLFADDDGGRALKHVGAAVFLISESINSNSDHTVIELSGVTDPEPLGDWEITLKRKN